MHIALQHTGRRFNREWIFRGVDLSIDAGDSLAILGSNGSGKSTLLQVINGNLQPSEGTITYTVEGRSIPVEGVYRWISLATPYQELIWDFTLAESIAFHERFKPFAGGLSREDIVELTGLGRHRDKALKYYSSGMKQRVRLALAILSDVHVILMDEPSMNLDAEGRRWYDALLRDHLADRTLIVCSNHQEEEYQRCRRSINILDYKA